MRNKLYIIKTTLLTLFASLSAFFAIALTAPIQAQAAVTPALSTPVEIFLDRDAFIKVPLEVFVSWFNIDGTTSYDATRTSGVEAPRLKLPCPTAHPLCSILISSRYQNNAHKTQYAVANIGAITTFLTNNSTQFITEARDAKFNMKNGRVIAFAPSSTGRALDIAESTQLIAAYADSVVSSTYPQRVKLIAKIIAPTVATSADAEKFGIRELIGEGRSDFTGSPANRVHNIKVAAAHFNGIILAPGKELSFVDLLGAVNGSTGYRKELVIIDNQTRPEYGGGVCQVSTTIFRAAILTGLEVTQRRSHSYAVKYYAPVGFDATIYIPNPNLKFKNSTAHHILIQNYIEGTELVFRIYGTSDGRTVNMKGPFITAYNTDGSPKKAYFTRTVLNKNGSTIFDETFYSNYKSPRSYPHPDDIARTTKPTTKPADWSKKQWSIYKKANGI